MCRAFGAIADLIHRKRSPFPYKGKALTSLRVGSKTFPSRARFFLLTIDY